jgi:hypothetical protein
VDGAIADGSVRDREREFPLFRVIDGVRETEGAIVARIETRREALAAETGLAGKALADVLAEELVDQAALRSALIGAGAALPLSWPLIGWFGSIVVNVTAGAILQLGTEVQLVYEVAAAYRTRLHADELRMVSFWLVRLTNYDDLQARALAIGVRVTVRKLVEKLVAVGLARAVGATATGMRVGQAAAAAPGPWYVRAAGFLGVPVLAAVGWRSTMAVGSRAIAYFTEELAGR